MLSVGDLERVLSLSTVQVCARRHKVILHDAAEAMPGNPPDLAQGSLDLRAAVIAQSLDEPGRDGVLRVVPGTDHERETEFGLIFRVRLQEPGDLLFTETIRIQPGGELLRARFARERAGDGCLTHEVWMGPDQGELALLAGPCHDLQRRRVERITGVPGARVPGLGCYPGRSLKEESEPLHERLAVEGFDLAHVQQGAGILESGVGGWKIVAAGGLGCAHVTNRGTSTREP